MLRKELQGLKEILKKQASHKLSTLAEMAIQVEKLPLVSEEMEHEDLVCSKCGDIFGKLRYTVTIMGLLVWRPL